MSADPGKHVYVKAEVGRTKSASIVMGGFEARQGRCLLFLCRIESKRPAGGVVYLRGQADIMAADGYEQKTGS